MSNYERDIRPKLNDIYTAARNGDFNKALTEINKPFSKVHPLRVPLEVLRIADSQGNREAAKPFIDKIYEYSSPIDITGGTSLKITFISEVAKEQINHPELYSVGDVTETLIRGMDTFSEAHINPNDYLYGQQPGIRRPAFYMSASGMPFGFNEAIDVCGALTDMGSAIIHFAQTRVNEQTPYDTLEPLVNKLVTTLKPNEKLQSSHPLFALIAQSLDVMKTYGTESTYKREHLETLGDGILQQLMIQYDNHPELGYISTKAKKALENPSATMEVASEVKDENGNK